MPESFVVRDTLIQRLDPIPRGDTGFVREGIPVKLGPRKEL
jgi:hypothetical protein